MKLSLLRESKAVLEALGVEEAEDFAELDEEDFLSNPRLDPTPYPSLDPVP